MSGGAASNLFVRGEVEDDSAFSQLSRTSSLATLSIREQLRRSPDSPSLVKKVHKTPARDPATIERSNLVNICKLVVKELLEQSLRFGRMLDSDHLPLQHFFIVLEHVLRHGLKPKKGLLGPKKELWDIMQSVEKYCIEAQDITTSVRDLPTVRTHIGRARAWLRLALMQKKLADYLHALVENRDDALAEYYEPHALMLSDEIIVIMGILVGLNVIDCNLCVKEEDLDSQQGVIDFSLYLRSSSRASPDEGLPPNQVIDECTGNMNTVLDQKNYIEELNRHLNATVANLQAKVENLTTTNALMKEDVAIARNSLLALQAENALLRRNTHSGASNSAPSGGTQIVEHSSALDRFESAMAETLAEERRKRITIEKELELQVSLKAESDMAMKILEKDIHDKQDTIISLRRQLDDIKQINLEMYRKLQECEASLKHKSDLLRRLESQKESMTNTIVDLEGKFALETADIIATSQALSLEVVNNEERVVKAETDLRVERELRNSLQEREIRLKEQIDSLQLSIRQLNDEARSHERLKRAHDDVQRKWAEAQITLEELGMQLSVTKLQAAELKEKVNGGTSNGSNGNGNEGTWTPDEQSSNCLDCERPFNITRRKHHCRNCGRIFCKSCSVQNIALPNVQGQMGKPVRVCNGCWDVINAAKN